MTPLLSFICAVFGTFRLSWEITRKDDEGGQFEGPLRLYDGIRWLFRHPSMPGWIQHAVDCIFCVSLWAAGFTCLLLPVYGGLSWAEAFRIWLLYTLGVGGIVVWWLRYMKALYGVGAGDI